MRARRYVATTAAVAALMLGGSILQAMPAAAAGGKCPPVPSGFNLWDVNTQPYQADNASDVNGDGWVCARPTKDTFVENGQTFTVYFFIDDNVRS